LKRVIKNTLLVSEVSETFRFSKLPNSTHVFRRFNSWLNSDAYYETVNQALAGNFRKLNGFLYVCDGLKSHRSAQFKQMCDKYNIELCEWPGYSPNFNAIEPVWNIIKQKILKKS
jgi:hypothetical protein